MSKILIVDDEPHLRLLYETELKRAGYETQSAEDAPSGLKILDSWYPDLVILDIRMSGMDGLEALQRILQRERRVPVIFNTAFSSFQDNYLTWAADAYITKSADVTELLDKVEELLQIELVADE
jgi:CheY-like chemotaxis protein